MKVSEIKFDCIYFKGEVPCLPNKLRGKVCSGCDEYQKIETRILIIKLGAIGDVMRSTPLLYRFKKDFPSSHITWITHTPEILPKAPTRVYPLRTSPTRIASAEPLAFAKRSGGAGPDGEVTIGGVDEICRFDFTSVYKTENTEYDIAINLDKDKEACILLQNVKAKRKFGFIWKGNHISIATPHAEHKLITGAFDTISKQNKKSYLEEIFEICDMKFSGEPYLLNFDPVLADKFNYIKDKAGNKRIIGLNTGCGKRWQTRLWVYRSDSSRTPRTLPWSPLARTRACCGM